MKRLLTYLTIIFSICSYSQGTTYKYFMYLNNSNLAPPFATVKGIYTYVGTDLGLKAFFAYYNISKFQKEYPSITDDEYFKCILRLETTNATLATVLMTNYSSTYSKYTDITNLPQAELLSYPNDYGATNPVTQPPYTGSAIERSDLDYMQVNRAWDITTGRDLITGQPISIGISDATINTTDSDFVGKVTSINPYLGNFEPHGTEVAGIAAARGNNSYGSTGVCYDCNIVGTWYDNFDNLELLAKSGVRVINMSWAHMFSTKLFWNQTYHQDIQNLINRIVTRYKVVLVAGAGNQSSYQTATDWYCEGGNQSGPSWTGMRYGFPASFDNVISVSSVQHKFPYTLPLSTSQPSYCCTSPLGIACYGLQGAIGTVNGNNPLNPIAALFNGWPRYCNPWQPNQYISSPNGLADSGHTLNPQVDILAPTWDTFKFYLFTTSGNPIVYAGGGTSGSAPRVSGTVGLMLSVNSCLYPSDVDAILKLTSKDVESLSFNLPYANNMGSGALNAGDAVIFVNEMKKTNGIAKITNHIFNRFDFNLDKINNKLEIEKITFRDNCRADFTARNSIRILPGTRFSPNLIGKVNLKINSSMDINCPPIDYSRTASENSNTYYQESKILLFPNPNNGSFDLFNVNFEEFGSENLNLFVYDLNGRKLHEDKITKDDNHHFEIQNLKIGVYILKIFSESKSKEIKFVRN
jgi:hypothetical protein